MFLRVKYFNFFMPVETIRDGILVVDTLNKYDDYCRRPKMRAILEVNKSGDRWEEWISSKGETLEEYRKNQEILESAHLMLEHDILYSLIYHKDESEFSHLYDEEVLEEAKAQAKKTLDKFRRL